MELSEEEFIEFINTPKQIPDYTMNGVYDKEDAIRIMGDISDIKLPILTEMTTSDITYYVESKRLYLIWIHYDVKVVVDFAVGKEPVDLSKYEELPLDNLQTVYKNVDTDVTDRIFYIAVMEDQYISITIHTQDEKLAERILSEMEISSLRILASQSKSNPDSPTDNQETVTDDTTTEPTAPEIIDQENPNTSDNGFFNFFMILFSFIILQCIMFLVKEQKTH